MTCPRQLTGRAGAEVADTGIGIAPQDIPKALEPFGQVDSSLARKYEGAGLGLPLTRQMVELHGGSADAWKACWTWAPP